MFVIISFFPSVCVELPSSGCKFTLLDKLQLKPPYTDLVGHSAPGLTLLRRPSTRALAPAQTGAAGPSRSAHTKFPEAIQLVKSNHPATLRAFGLHPSPPTCLTKASGTPAPETTARALAPGTKFIFLSPARLMRNPKYPPYARRSFEKNR